MSRQRDRIAKAVADHGFKLDRIDWRPISMGGEKSGAVGGWEAWYEGGFGVAVGLSVEGLIADLDSQAADSQRDHD